MIYHMSKELYDAMRCGEKKPGNRPISDKALFDHLRGCYGLKISGFDVRIGNKVRRYREAV